MAESSPTPPYRRERRGSIDNPPSFLNQLEVLCDFCEETKLKALKSCLVCQSSYCETHLQPHFKLAGLSKHKLMEPVSNLEDYICQKHKKPLEQFCRDDQTCLCMECAVQDHMYHDTVSIEEESENKKTQLMKTQKNAKEMIQERVKKIQDIKNSAEVRKSNTEKEKAASDEIFTNLIRSIERCQTEVLVMIEERQKAAEKQEQELIEELEQEITEIETRNTELEQLSHTEDHLHLLQIYPSLHNPTKTRSYRDLPEIRMKAYVNQEALSRHLTQLQDILKNTLKNTLQNTLHEILTQAVVVTLDPDTAHPKLILSADGKQVRHGDFRQELPDSPKRFNKKVCVLGKEGFSSGSFYFEVQVKGKIKWTLGVAQESINRKGDILQSPSNGYWTVWLRNGNKYAALSNPLVPLSLRGKPQRVGVFVDYEEGLVSFYDAESSSLIYSYTGQTFKGKLYPYFSPCFNDGGKNSAPLIITPVNYKT